MLAPLLVGGTLLAHKGLRLPERFTITLCNGRKLESMHSGPEILHGEDRTSKVFDDPESGLVVKAEAIRRGAYTREIFVLTATKGDVDVARFDAIVASMNHPRVVGAVQGSPVVSDDLFVALEHPMASNTVEGQIVRCGIERKLPIHPGAPVTYSAVMGGYRPGGLRREFLAYLEAERPRRYKPFLHYNSWYDIGYFTPYTADQGVDRIVAFGEALTKRRGVKLASFLFDDG